MPGCFPPVWWCRRVVTNDEIIQRYDLIATDRAVQFSLGIQERRYADEDAYVSDLLAEAARQCLDRANISAEQVDRIIYTKLMGDQMIPATAIKVVEKLGIRRGFQLLTSWLPAVVLCT